VHFIYDRGKGPHPTPIILSHGWPWTYRMWHKVIRPLTDPASFGGDPNQSFDVIVPSLLGFGFSTPLMHADVRGAVFAGCGHYMAEEAPAPSPSNSSLSWVGLPLDTANAS
jgi:alpha/beta hydrolase family protein